MADNFEITSSALPSQAIVAAFRGSEGISRPYVFDVYVALESLGDDIDVDDAPGSSATLTIKNPDGEDVKINGLIVSMELLRSVSLNGSLLDKINSLYRLQLVPHLWLLSLTKHSRIWAQKNIPDIIKDVLDDERVPAVQFRLEKSYDVEEHVTQYKESSLNFIHRWMERLGMYYFFEQTDEGEVMVITDANASSSPSVTRPVPYAPGGTSDGSAGAHLETFAWRHATTPSAVRFTDYDYAKPTLEMVANAAVSPIGVGEQVTYGGRFFTKAQGDTIASVRAEDLRARARNFHGAGRVYGLTSGYRFSVDRHPRAQLNTEYLAVSVEHYGAVSNQMSSWGKLVPHDHLDETYYVEFTAVEATQQYRHPETAKWPQCDGFENAVVDGGSTSEYAQLDDQGRYKVKFKFDEGTLRSGQASTWVRKSQPHAGTVEGWHFPERAGTEVICAFLGGDPDRPIIIGAVPTITTTSPVTSSNHTQNVIQTGGKNRFEMEDRAGSQRVTMSTPHASSFISFGHPLTGLGQVYNGDQQVPDHTMAIWTDGAQIIFSGATTDLNIGDNWNVWVASNHVEIIGVDMIHHVGGKMEQTITGLLLQDVNGTVTEAYHSTLDQGVQGAVTIDHKSTFDHTVKGAVTETFKAGQTMEITGDRKVHVTGSEDVTVDGDRVWQIGGNHGITFKAAKTEHVMGICHNTFVGLKNEANLAIKIEETIGAKIELQAAIKVSMTAGAYIELVPARFNVNLNRAEVRAQQAEVEAMKSTLRGLQSTLGAIRSFTGAVCQQNSGLQQKQAVLKNRISALNSDISGLHSKL